MWVILAGKDSTEDNLKKHTFGLVVLCCLAFGLLLVTGGVSGSEISELSNNESFEVQDAGQVEISDSLQRNNGTVNVLVGLSADENIESSIESHDKTSRLKKVAERSQSDLQQFAKQSDGITIRNQFWVSNFAVLSIDTNRHTYQSIARVNNVEWIHPNKKYNLTLSNPNVNPGVFNTELKSSATDINSTYGLSQIRTPQAWEKFNTKGGGVNVTVLDTGINESHPDLDLAPGGWAEFNGSGHEVTSSPHDDDVLSGHGTHTSGTVAGGNTSGEYIGVAPNVSLHHGLVISGFWRTGTVSQVVAGIEWAVNTTNADVISMSLGFPDKKFNNTLKNVVQNAVNNAGDTGTIVVVSAGNSGENTSKTPGNVADVISVGASDAGEQIAKDSSGEVIDKSEWTNPPNYWPEKYTVPSISAPGVGIKSTSPNGQSYHRLSGTSMAAPHVAGAVALMQAATTQIIDANQIEEALEMSASKPGPVRKPNGVRDTRYGAGIIDIPTAIQLVKDDPAAAFVLDEGAPKPGEQLTFYGNASTNLTSTSINSYKWDFTTDGQIDQTGKVVTHSFSEFGEKNVTLTINDSNGNTAQFSRIVDVTRPVQNWSINDYFDLDFTKSKSVPSVTVVNDTAFRGYRGGLEAINTTTGTEEWNFSTTQPVTTSPAVNNSTVIFSNSSASSSSGGLYALNTQTVNSLWNVTLGQQVYSSPTIRNNSVYVGSNDTKLYAFDENTGSEEWNLSTGGPILSSPTVVDGTVFVGSDDGKLYAVDAQTGTELWNVTTGGPVRSSPTFRNDTVFVGSDDSKVYALDARTGKQWWEFDTGGPVRSSPTVADISLGDVSTGVVFVGSDDGSLYAIDEWSGYKRGEFATGGPIRSSPTVANGTVVFGSDDGTVYAVDADADTTMPEAEWTFEAGWEIRTSPTIVNGTIYVGSGNNTYALHDRTLEASSDGSRVRLGTLGHHKDSIEPTIGPSPIAGNEPPRDMTGDGLYEDVNGDGLMTDADVSLLIDTYLFGNSNKDTEFFNFHGGNPSDVSLADVQFLADKVDPNLDPNNDGNPTTDTMGDGLQNDYTGDGNSAFLDFIGLLNVVSSTVEDGRPPGLPTNSIPNTQPLNSAQSNAVQVNAEYYNFEEYEYKRGNPHVVTWADVDGLGNLINPFIDITGDGNDSSDVNADSLLEDINGDGTFDKADTDWLNKSQNRNKPIVQNNAQYFNFAKGDPFEVTQADAQALANRL